MLHKSDYPVYCHLRQEPFPPLMETVIFLLLLMPWSPWRAEAALSRISMTPSKVWGRMLFSLCVTITTIRWLLLNYGFRVFSKTDLWTSLSNSSLLFMKPCCWSEWQALDPLLWLSFVSGPVCLPDSHSLSELLMEILFQNSAYCFTGDTQNGCPARNGLGTGIKLENQKHWYLRKIWTRVWTLGLRHNIFRRNF